MAADVECAVDSCYYWGSGNKCTANAIKVNHNGTAMATSATAMEAGTLGPRAKARHSDHTRCDTFKPK
ncbi:MAG: DUF1540 domain-containing protein [Firmicutes bacterium]|nr:DUF1540 domain-containing protein [Bacillota bacterium]